MLTAIITGTYLIDDEDEGVSWLSTLLDMVPVYVDLGLISMLVKAISSLSLDDSGVVAVAATFVEAGNVKLATFSVKQRETNNM